MARKKKESKVINELEDKSILSIQQMVLPLINKNDMNRLQMVCSQITQALPLVESDEPRIQSIYNKDMVKHSNMVVKAKEDMINLGEVKLQNERFLLMLGDKEMELYNIDTPLLSSAFTGYNTYVTNKNKLKKDDNILINANASMSENLKFGINALVGYMVYGDNFEDSIIISESFSNKLRHVEKDIIDIIVNKNEYLLNLYGDENRYKCFPDIGEKIDENSRILCAKRVINKGWNSFTEISKISNMKINFFNNDTVYYDNGIVKDISVFSNIHEDVEENDFIKSLNEYIDKNSSDIKYFLSLVEPHLKRYKDKNDYFTFGPNLQYYYNKFRKIDKDNVLTYNNKKFDGYLVRITIEREVKADIGCKLSNTHGECTTI